MVVSLAVAFGIALVLVSAMLANPQSALTVARPGWASGSFYDVIPLWAMNVVGITSFGYALVALGMGARNFWRDAGAKSAGPVAFAMALWDVLTLRNFGRRRQWLQRQQRALLDDASAGLHHGLFYGFMLCFAATCVGFIYDSVLGWQAPYPLASAPVLLGSAGGVLLLVGTVGMFAMRLVGDPAVSPRKLLGADVALADATDSGGADRSWCCWRCAGTPARWGSRSRCIWG